MNATETRIPAYVVGKIESLIKDRFPPRLGCSSSITAAAARSALNHLKSGNYQAAERDINQMGPDNARDFRAMLRNHHVQFGP